MQRLAEAAREQLLDGAGLRGVEVGLPLGNALARIDLDGSVILELSDRLISDPGVHIEIGG